MKWNQKKNFVYSYFLSFEKLQQVYLFLTMMDKIVKMIRLREQTEEFALEVVSVECCSLLVLDMEEEIVVLAVDVVIVVEVLLVVVVVAVVVVVGPI